MPQQSVSRFYDELAADYHLIYVDWDAALRRQAAALGPLLELAGQPAAVLGCACGIGTQALGLALRGHRVTGTDLSPRAAARASREAALRDVRLPTAAADMRRLPFPADTFDAVVCADNSLPHLLTPEDIRAALTEMRRVPRPGGLLLVGTRDYDALRAGRPASTPPQLHGRAVTFQLWHWHEDGERYDLEHFQLVPGTEGEARENWEVRVRRTTYWALPRARLSALAREAGLTAPSWRLPEETGFFQPLLLARKDANGG
ncbi:class I SAM-dependent methyltransferase [Streptomyces sp. NPDC088768]|uniref:class I SAM-dependent methyltransferase n=1 Tax=Streptomyces sp. NPDC088768 TaxID=3365894 RepID=UPI003808E10D